MIADSGRLDIDVMELPIVTEDNPAPLAAMFQPFVIRHVLSEFVFLVVLIFNRERRTAPFQRLGKALSEASVKIES